jgi:acyl-CoA thioester hydrolase
MDMTENVCDLELKVRDYECDMDHVVNHAVYLNYLEHARHEFLSGLGIKFGELSKRGISLVVTRIEADFKASLISGDAFFVRTSFSRKGRVRLQFSQSIYRMPDSRLMLNAVVTGTALNARGRPEVPLELALLLGPWESDTARTPVDTGAAGTKKDPSESGL